MTASQAEKLNYQEAQKRLVDLFERAENAYREKTPPEIDSSVAQAADVLFSSSTQSYREALLGCGLARLLNRSINIRHPYIKHGNDAFNGRTLDEKVINPFLHDRMIPSSKGPYLATFRRSVKFISETREGLRDKEGYDAFLTYIDAFENAQTDEEIENLLIYLLYCFAALRDTSTILLAKIARLSLDQYERLIDRLLQTPSGGLLPVLLTVAMFNTIRRCFNLDWEIEWQGINVPDSASAVGGDITIKRGGEILLAVEITERPVDRLRVMSTFQTKIAPHSIRDYLFFSGNEPSDETRQVAMQYFAQGHDVSFLQVKPWLINVLGTIGHQCRSLFTDEFLCLLDKPDVPATLKVAWNDTVKSLLA